MCSCLQRAVPTAMRVCSYIVPTRLLPVVKLCLWGLPALASRWRFTALFGKGVCALVYVTNVSSVLHQQSHFYTVDSRKWKFGSLITLFKNFWGNAQKCVMLKEYLTGYGNSLFNPDDSIWPTLANKTICKKTGRFCFFMPSIGSDSLWN